MKRLLMFVVSCVAVVSVVGCTSAPTFTLPPVTPEAEARFAQMQIEEDEMLAKRAAEEAEEEESADQGRVLLDEFMRSFERQDRTLRSGETEDFASCMVNSQCQIGAICSRSTQEQVKGQMGRCYCLVPYSKAGVCDFASTIERMRGGR